MSSRYRHLLREVRARLDAAECPYRFSRIEIGAAIDEARRFYGTAFIVKTEDPMREFVVQRAADMLFDPLGAGFVFRRAEAIDRDRAERGLPPVRLIEVA